MSLPTMRNSTTLDNDQALFADSTAKPPTLSSQASQEEPRYDEEPQAVPGSFLEALPQFFVFPAILVVSLTAIYLLLRTLAGSAPGDARELLDELRVAGPHGRWQVLYTLSDGLRRGSLDLAGVETAELASLYDGMSADVAEGPAQAALMRQQLLLVLAHKRDPALTPYALAEIDAADPGLRRGALQALAVMGDPAAVPALAAVLDGDDVEERLLALGALGNIHDDPAAADLVAARFLDADTVLARNAVLLRARAADERALPFLGRLLDRSAYDQDAGLDGGVAGMDEASRAESRADAVEAFLVEACKAAAALGHPSLEGALEKLREGDPSIKVRSAAINALHDLNQGV